MQGLCARCVQIPTLYRLLFLEVLQRRLPQRLSFEMCARPPEGIWC